MEESSEALKLSRCYALGGDWQGGAIWVSRVWEEGVGMAIQILREEVETYMRRETAYMRLLGANSVKDLG
ncbi:hypothetical protein BGX38DRAFT_1177337, partial [Terfezia claveryi]